MSGCAVQEAIFEFERTSGVVATIRARVQQEQGVAEALSAARDCVCTIQTFPFALKAVQELAATQGNASRLIADERTVRRPDRRRQPEGGAFCRELQELAPTAR